MNTTRYNRYLWPSFATLSFACMWPLLSFLNVNTVFLSIYTLEEISDVIYFTALVWFFLVVLAILLVKFRPNSLTRILITLSILTVQSFMFMPLRTIFIDLFEWANMPASGGLASLIVTLALAFGIWKISKHVLIQRIVMIFMFSGFIVALAQFTFNFYDKRMNDVKLENSTREFTAPALSSPFIRRDSVYYFILDTYPGSDSLSNLGFDNTSFLEAMSGRGFVELKGQSNYLQTYLSLTAILEMSYPVEENSPIYKNISDFYPISLNRGRHPKAAKVFDEEGYKLRRISNFWGGCDNWFDCYSAPMNKWRPSEVLKAYLAPTFLSVIHGRIAFSDAPALLRFLEESDKFFKEGPNFVFAHNMSPHPPAKFDEECNPLVANKILSNDWKQTDKEQFFDAITCTNKMVLDVTAKIIENDPNAIIIFQGDHGSSFNVDFSLPHEQWSQDSLKERGSFLNLVRTPRECAKWFKPRMGQVNTMRFVIGCLQQKSPDYLPEQNFINYHEGQDGFGKVFSYSIIDGDQEQQQ